ncbi:hypothetical protein B0H13DRAFT_2336575 [Mycena leptocephala]|nr:hypothetical protein B0H13DRAFT_2336575 [Mycena leptocephala]
MQRCVLACYVLWRRALALNLGPFHSTFDFTSQMNAPPPLFVSYTSRAILPAHPFFSSPFISFVFCLSVLYHSRSTLALSACSPLVMPAWTPPYHPCPVHESRADHDHNAQCLYYAVWEGRVRGGFTNSWLAREQTDGWSDSRQKSFKTWTDLLAWWQHMCLAMHQGNCPPFEPVNFSLDPDPTTHPSSPSCMRPAADDAPETTPSSAPAASSYQPSYVQTGAAIAGGSSGAPPAYNAAGAAASSTIPTAAPSPFTSSSSSYTTAPTSPSPSPKKEEPEDSPNIGGLSLAVLRVTMQTCVQLTPTGQARAAALRTATSSAAVSSPTPPASSAAPTIVATLARGAANAPLPSILVTPGPAAAAPPPPAATAHITQYGIRGVGVFYDSYASARAAAQRLGLSGAKIMVTDNAEKLEAWITGQPFIGEDEDA